LASRIFNTPFFLLLTFLHWILCFHCRLAESRIILSAQKGLSCNPQVGK